MSTNPEPGEPGAWLIPRGLLIVLGLASGVVVFAGMRATADIVAPVILALALTITVYPLRTWLQRRGAPRWLATLVVLIGVYAVVLGLMFAVALSVTRFVTLLPTYVPQIQQNLDDLRSWLSGLGIGNEEIQKMLKGLDPGTIVGWAESLLGSAASVLSTLVFILAMLFFLGIDSAAFASRMAPLRLTRARALGALGSFASGTRTYFAVSTIFGGIVALLDGAALLAIGVPAAGLWTLLAFVTNYIPNVGFVIGLIPPALLALLTLGVGQMLLVIVVYCVLNLVIQSVLQPKFVGDAVGLTTTVSFVSLIVWAFVLGPLGAILAVPMTLLVKAVLVDSDPDARWLQLFLGDEPDHTSRRQRKALAAAAAEDAANEEGTAAAGVPTDAAAEGPPTEQQ